MKIEIIISIIGILVSILTLYISIKTFSNKIKNQLLKEGKDKASIIINIESIKEKQKTQYEELDERIKKLENKKR